MKYYVLHVGENGPNFYAFDNTRTIQEYVDEMDDKPEIKTSMNRVDMDESGWMMVIKGEIVVPKTRQVTEEYWEATE